MDIKDSKATVMGVPYVLLYLLLLLSFIDRAALICQYQMKVMSPDISQGCFGGFPPNTFVL